MTKPVLLLDCDGILTNYAAQTVELLNILQSERVYVEHDITDWEVSSYVPKHKRDEYWGVCKSRGFVTRMKPYAEAQAAVDLLRTIAEIVVVTSYLKGAPTWTHERDEWLRVHYGIMPSHIIHTRAKHHVFGHVFVDDALKNVIPWGQRFKNSTALLWHKPYNRDLRDITDTSDMAYYRRINTWDAVIDVVRRCKSDR